MALQMGLGLPVFNGIQSAPTSAPGGSSTFNEFGGGGTATDPTASTGTAGSGSWFTTNAPGGTTAGPATGGAAGGGGGLTPEQIMQQDPGFQFRLNESMQALQRSAAARGTLLTGGTLKDLTQFGQDYASGEFGNIFNRNYQLASLGENAAAMQGNLGSSYGNSASNLLTGIGNAQAAGTVGGANAWNGALGSIGSTLGNLAIYGSTLPSGTGASASSYPYYQMPGSF